MKKNLLVLYILIFVGLLLLPMTGSAQWGPGYGWAYCPYCGSQVGYRGDYGYGCGMGSGMGGGMMGRGQGYGPQQYRQQRSLDEKDARALVEGNLQASRNPNLKVGGIKDVGNAYQVDIVTKDNAPVDKVLVDKQTGMTRSAYR